MYLQFPTTEFRENLLSQLTSKYSFLKEEKIGESACGRDIKAYFLGESEDCAVLCAGIHGSEYLTVLSMLEFLCDSCKSVETHTTVCGFRLDRFFARKGICIIPCLNPDGTEISIKGSSAALKYKDLVNSITNNTSIWQANARGVDLNHNFDAGWQELKKKEISLGINSPAASRFGGEYPESEPEVKALIKLCEQKHFTRAYAFHSQGREIYCEYGDKTPQRGVCIAKILSDSSGYTVSTPESIATGGGFKDWFIEKYEKPGITIEIGKGKNPLPLSDFAPEYLKIQEMLCFCAIL